MSDQPEKKECKHERTWFDRTMCFRADGQERMATICEDCGDDGSRLIADAPKTMGDGPCSNYGPWDKLPIIEAIGAAWASYTAAFGVPPHGGEKSIAGLLEFGFWRALDKWLKEKGWAGPEEWKSMKGDIEFELRQNNRLTREYNEIYKDRESLRQSLSSLSQERDEAVYALRELITRISNSQKHHHGDHNAYHAQIGEEELIHYRACLKSPAPQREGEKA